jgi:hypothetical protein
MSQASAMGRLKIEEHHGRARSLKPAIVNGRSRNGLHLCWRHLLFARRVTVKPNGAGAMPGLPFAADRDDSTNGVSKNAARQERAQVRHPSGELLRRVPCRYSIASICSMWGHDMRRLPLRYRIADLLASQGAGSAAVSL